MGRTTRWLRNLLGGKKHTTDQTSNSPKDKRKWAFVKSFKDNNNNKDPRLGSYREASAAQPSSDGSVDPNKHAIAVAAATAAVAEAAVAAAQAAAAVVRLTSSGRCTAPCIGSARGEDSAAVKIQSAFRGYLARRALKALKALVKLQALVRGHIVRKQTAEALRYIQVLVRAQARARAARSHILDNRHLSKGSQVYQGPATPEKQERRHNSTAKSNRPSSLKRSKSKPNGTDKNQNGSDSCMDEQYQDDREASMKGGAVEEGKGDKILEVDPGKPHLNSKQRVSGRQSSSSTTLNNSRSFATMPDSPSKDSTTAQLSVDSPSSVEVQSLSPLRFPVEADDTPFCTADNSPQFFSATSSRLGSVKRGPFTPAKSDCSGSFLSGYSYYPNYMANTESSRAKVRSHSAPKQRPEYEKSSSIKRFSVHGCGDGRMNNGITHSAQRSLHSKFASKAYPGSGRLDRLGMPVREVVGSNTSNRYRF